MPHVGVQLRGKGGQPRQVQTVGGRIHSLRASLQQLKLRSIVLRVGRLVPG